MCFVYLFSGAISQVMDKPTPEELAEAERLKDIGNGFFKKAAFKEAVEAYSRALAACKQSNATYFSNRHLNIFSLRIFGFFAKIEFIFGFWIG